MGENGGSLKDNSTMDKTEAQIVPYGILYLNPSSDLGLSSLTANDLVAPTACLEAG